MNLTLPTHQAYLMKEAVTGLANALATKVAAGDYWLTRTLHELEELNHKLRSTAVPQRSYGIGEAA